MLELLRMEDERNLCLTHPAFLLDFVSCVDAKTGETFEFDLLTADERVAIGRGNEPSGWHWQREVLDHWLASDMSIVLKARQLGVTWLAAGLGLWTILAKPGSKVLCISINEDEASKIVNRLWDMFMSLPEHLKMGVKVLKPSRGARPFTHIELQHTNGMISRVVGLPSTSKAGHGETAAVVIMDEFARHDYAAESWKALLPTTAGGGRILAISTANGVSNPTTGEGNFFHYLWVNGEDSSVARHFLKWSLHPDRDHAWYQKVAMALPAKDRAEQFPNTAEEAFILTGDQYFDAEALKWYVDNAVRRHEYRFQFVERERGKAARESGTFAPIRVYREPEKDHEYALAADVATGRGKDYSCAYVIDLSNMELCAEYHAKSDADLYAAQLHYLGRWFNTARIAIEMGGGYGEAVVIALRDGREGRPAYPKLYRHTMKDRPEYAEMKPYGFPMTTKTRPLVLNQLEKAIRDHDLPWMTEGLIMECQTFIHADTNPSPRAQEGCNDDRVMASAIALEMYRQYGAHPEMRKRKPARTHKPLYPWQRTA